MALLVALLSTQVYGAPNYRDIAHQIRSDHIAYVKRTHGYSLSMTGGGMMDCVEYIDVGFEAGQPKSVPEVRRIFVHLLDHFFHLINSSKAVRPYLIAYPFPVENIRYFLNFKTYLLKPGAPEVTHVALLNGKICYMFLLEDGKEEFMLRETFAEAKQILEAEEREKITQGEF